MLSRVPKAREELISALSHRAVPGCPASSACLSAHMCHPPKETNRNDWSQRGTSILQADSDHEDFLCIRTGHIHTQDLRFSQRARDHLLAQKRYHPQSQVPSTFHPGRKDS